MCRAIDGKEENARQPRQMIDFVNDFVGQLSRIDDRHAHHQEREQIGYIERSTQSQEESIDGYQQHSQRLGRNNSQQ